LALRQPTAFDLRLLLAVIKIIHELERTGNKAKRIAEMAIKLANHTNSMPKHDLERMVELVIARAIAIEPEVLLLDEPASALDPISTLKIEELINELKEKYTIVIVTHNMQQAARVSDYTAFMYMGELIEIGTTSELFTNPSKKQTEDYITGRYG